MSAADGLPADAARFGLYLVLTNPRVGYETCAVAAVQAVGAVNFAVVRAVCGAAFPFDAIRRLQEIWETYAAGQPM